MTDIRPKLPDLVAAAEARALAGGSLSPLTMEQFEVEDADPRYVVSWVSSLAAKALAALLKPKGDGPPANPFLPYEPALHVADLGPAHVLLLNKFPMERGHTLIVTRGFRQQQALLELADLASACRLFAELDGLVMFNGGRIAGASQDHRHLHFLPTLRLPLDGVLSKAPIQEGLQRSPRLSFPHALIRFRDDQFADPDVAAAAIHQMFLGAAADLGLPGGEGLTGPTYSLLMTRRWMLVVPRSREHFEAEGERVSLNALHYGGWVVVARRELMEVVHRAGLQAVLAAGVGVPASGEAGRP